MKRVMAQGTFDVLHPGHLHYLRVSATFGDELHVVIARDERVADRKDVFIPDRYRRDMVGALEVVDEAHLGSEGSIYDILDVVEPDVVTLGHDQPYDPDEVRAEIADQGYEVTVERIGRYEPTDAEIVSSRDIKERARRAYDVEGHCPEE